MNADRLLAFYERIADAPDAIVRLRRFILNLAVRGKLVGQDPADEPASELLKRIAEEKWDCTNYNRRKKNEPDASRSATPTVSIPQIWSWAKLGDLSLRLHYGYTASANPKLNEVRLIRITDIQNNNVDWRKVPGCRIDKHSLQNYLLARGDLLIARTGGTIGKTFLVSDIPVVSVFASYLIRVRPARSLFDQYIKLFCESDIYWSQLREGSRGGAQPNVNGKTLGRMFVPVPPLSEQRRIVAKVDELMALCDRLEAARAEREATRDRLSAASLARLNVPDPNPSVFQGHAAFALDNLAPLTTRLDQIKALRQTILNLAVRGKLVEQDRADEPASGLLKRIAAEKARLVRAGESRKSQPLIPVVSAEQPFAIPISWEWVSSTYPTYGVSDLGKKIKTKDVLESGAFPVVDQGKILVRGYCNDPRKVVKVFEPLIVFGDHTRETKLIDFDFVVGADGVKILQPVGIDAPFYHLALQWLPLESRGYSRHFKLLKSSYIPLPPLAEQQRIVAKVDELMALCDRLEGSLGAADTTRHRLLESLLQDALELAANELETVNPNRK